MEKTSRILNILMLVVVVLLSIHILLLDIGQATISSLLIAVLFLVAGYLFYKNVKHIQRWLIVGLALSFLLRLSFALIVQTPASSDFEMMLNAAQSVINGDLSCFQQGYFQDWAYQTAFVLYEAAVLKCTGGSIFALKLLNILFMVAVNYLIYRIGKKVFNEKVGLVALLAYAVYPAPILLSSVLTNQHISTFFACLAIYFLVRKAESLRIIDYIIAAFCMFFANLMRPEIIVVIAALCVIMVLRILRSLAAHKKKETLYLIRNSGVCIIIYFVLMTGASFLVSSTGINQNGLTNQKPEWKFTVGLDTDSDGSYNERHIDILSIDDEKERKEYLQLLLKQYFSKSPTEIIKFFDRKLQSMWTGNEPLYWSMAHLNDQETVTGNLMVLHLMQLALRVDKGIYLAVWLLVALQTVQSIYLLIKRKFDERKSFLSAMVCVYLCVYLLIEIQTRYRYWLMPLLFILGAGGLAFLSGIVPRIASVHRSKKSFDIQNDKPEEKGCE